MAYQQMAKLFLRGTLCNKTLKNLTPEQRQEIENIVETVMEDPNLQQCRKEFCNALARTIKSEYEDREVGEQDYRIALMRAAIAAKYDKKPAQHAITDPIQRKKWFQTWVFNYLRQILRENKLPMLRSNQHLQLPADQAALHIIQAAIDQVISIEHDLEYKRALRGIRERLVIKEIPDGYEIVFDHWSFPIELIHLVREIITTYLNYGIEIRYTHNAIRILRLKTDLPKINVVKRNSSLVKVTSFDENQKENEDEDNRRDQLEMSAISCPAPDTTLDRNEIFYTLRNRIPDEAQPILSIYMEDTRPSDYVERYGPGAPHVTHIAEYLNKSPHEVKRLLNNIKIQCMALQLGY